MLQISQNAEDLIISEEVGSKKEYERRYRHPEWPQGASGITVGIGYDVGYATKDRVATDWAEIPNEMVVALQGVAGMKGESAHSVLSSVRNKVDISLDQAMHVFDKVDMPRWIATVNHSLPNCDKLDPNCMGAIVSLSYNRGASFNLAGDRYAEMRAIKVHMINEEFDRIPGEFRKMRRLWNNGLVGRREREAKLFERGLEIMRGHHLEETAPKVATREQEAKRNAAGAAVASATASGAGSGFAPAVQDNNHHTYIVVGAIVLGFVIGLVAITYIGRHKILPKADPIPQEAG